MVIPPPPPGWEALPGADLDDLSQVNFSTWAEAVQDVAAGKIGLLPDMSNGLYPVVQDLLVCLESATRVAFCHKCYQLGANCRCPGAPTTTTTSSSTSVASWSEIADPAPTRRVPTSAPLQSVPSVVPPPGLHLPGAGSIWNLPIPDFPALLRPPGSIHQPLPPAGRGAIQQSQLRAAQERRAAQDTQYALPLPSWTQPAMPYLQQVQPPAWLPPSPPHSDSAATPSERPALPEG